MEEIARSSQAGSVSPVLSLLGKEKDMDHNKNDSLKSIDIQEMERVRLSLQSMLKSSEHFLQDEKTSPRTSPDMKRYTTRDEGMFSGITTANLMSNYLNTDTKEVKISSDSTALSDDNDPIRTSNKKYDKSLLLENTLLNESLEKERSKRKHCEQQIKGLQAKLLVTQQELAVAVSADRKKDVMINQLDKTLARVVEDWKKHEEEKFDAMNKLEVQHGNDAKFQQRQREILAQFEKDLSLAAEALSQEQARAAKAEREKDTQLAALFEERDELLQLLEEEKAKNANVEKEYESLEEHARSSRESQRLFEQEKHVWQEEKSQLESQIEVITKAHTDDLENERRLVEQEKQVAEDSQRVLNAVQKEVQQLTVQLDTCFREKENLKTEITLLTAKFEAQRTRQDSEHRAELERQISKNLREAQSQLSRNENEINSAHKKQIEDLTKRYRSDLEEQLNNFHQQLKERDRKMKETSDEYEERLTKSDNDLVRISNEREALGKEKHKMISRLQKMMQSHCAEAMSVLTTTTENTVGTFNERRDSTWMLRQTPVLVTSAANVGGLRDSTRTFPTSVTHDNHSHVMQSSAIRNRSHLTSQQPLQYTYISNTENDDSEHTWIRLPAMPADTTTTHVTYPSTSYITNEAVSNGLRRTTQAETQQREGRSVHHPPEESRYPEIEEEEISPTTTNESLMEQSPDDQETTKPYLPVNLSTDVLKMLQQQQSQQTELNHYVHQLLKKSPSNNSNGEFTADVAVVTSDGGYADANKHHRLAASPNNSPPDMLSSESTYSDLGDVQKQMAFTKSAATPGKRFDKIPVAQTPPSKDRPLEKEKSPGKSVLTPEQVGQLARLIQMYQKDNEDNDLPSPQKMFQYLREVQIRGENEGIMPSKDHSKQRSQGRFFEEATNAPEHIRKESKAKRKLEVNIQAGKLKEVPVLADPNTTDNSADVARKHFLLDETRRSGRATFTSDSELATIRKLDNKTTKSRKSHVPKPLKRGSAKSAKAWK